MAGVLMSSWLVFRQISKVDALIRIQRSVMVIARAAPSAVHSPSPVSCVFKKSQHPSFPIYSHCGIAVCHKTDPDRSLAGHVYLFKYCGDRT